MTCCASGRPVPQSPKTKSRSGFTEIAVRAGLELKPCRLTNKPPSFAQNVSCQPNQCAAELHSAVEARGNPASLPRELSGNCRVQLGGAWRRESISAHLNFLQPGSGESQRDSDPKPGVARNALPRGHRPALPTSTRLRPFVRFLGYDVGRNLVEVAPVGRHSPKVGAAAPTLGFEPQPRWGCKKLRSAQSISGSHLLIGIPSKAI